MRKRRDPLQPIAVREHHELPVVWLIVAALVGVGVVVNVTIDIFASGGLTIWPFVFTAATLLLINDASDRNGVGVPPLHVYGLMLGVLVFLMAFVWLISHVNPWVLFILVATLAGYVGYDWRQRRLREQEMVRRRLASLCVRCVKPVDNELEAICPTCGMAVHPERLTLLRLGRAIGQMGNSDRVRQTLAKNPQQRQAPKMASSSRPITKAYSYGKRK